MLDKNNPHVGYKHTVCWIQIPICWMQTARMMWIQECCKSRKDNLVVMVIISLQTALFLIFIIQATLPEQLSSPLVLSGVLVTRSLVLCVMLCSCLTFCPFSFGHCVVCPLRILIISLVSSNSYYDLKRKRAVDDPILTVLYL